MSDVEQARATQLRNIETRLNRSLASLRTEIEATGLTKHGEIRSWLIERYQLGYGDANAVAHAAQARAAAAEDADPLAAIYAAKKAHLRPIHDALVEAMAAWGEYEVAPKKAYVSLRRKKQFAMLGPKNATTAELGINLKDEISSDRLVAQKPGGMCQYAVGLTCVDDIDAEVLAVLRRAFDAAG